jgi:1,4-dihydroxy-2-naphthoate octaprenyltransferase
MTKTSAWIKAMRLRTLPLSFSVIIVGNALAYASYFQSDRLEPIIAFRWDILSLTLVTTLLLHILSNFANEYGDANKGSDNENRIGPERAVQIGVITAAEMLRGIIITALLSLVSGIILLIISFGSFNDVFIQFLILGILAILGAIGYTVGKKAYGYRGLGDFFVFIFFGLLGVFGSYYLHFQEVHPPVIIFGVMMGALSTAVLNLNNMRDRVNDESVGKRTLAVRFGFKGSKRYHYVLFILFWLPLLSMIGPVIKEEWLTALIFSPILFIHILHLKQVIKTDSPKDFDPELKKIALSAFLFSILFFITIYLSL